MSQREQPIKNESWMEFFWRTKRFSDFILLAWHLIEFDTNQLVARQYGLHYHNYHNKEHCMGDLVYSNNTTFYHGLLSIVGLVLLQLGSLVSLEVVV
jgi:hypothetical protein